MSKVLNVLEMAEHYYPKYWSKERLQALVDAGRLKQEDMDALVARVAAQESV